MGKSRFKSILFKKNLRWPENEIFENESSEVVLSALTKLKLELRDATDAKIKVKAIITR